MKILKYICCLLILLIILFYYCHITKLKTINNKLNILQTTDPTYDISFELFEQHQPIIFQNELLFWKDFNKLINKSLDDIKETITQNATINYTDIVKTNLAIYNLPLSYEWIIDIRNIILDDSSGIYFIKQTNYLQCFGCITGEFRIIIMPPDQHIKLCTGGIINADNATKNIKNNKDNKDNKDNENAYISNNVYTKDASALLNTEPIDINYIEIVIRKGNLIYIPWHWLYFIYKPTTIIETVIIDCVNKSFLTCV